MTTTGSARTPAPEVLPRGPAGHDAIDASADDLGTRAWRWRPATRRAAGATAAVLWASAAAVLALHRLDPATVGAALLVVAPAAAGAGVLAGRARRSTTAVTLLALAAALAVVGVWASAGAHGWPGPLRAAGLAGAVAAALALAGWCTPLGRPALTGAAAVLGCLVLGEAAVLFQGGADTAVRQSRAAALPAVAAGLALGVLPRLALTASGLTALDDRRSAGVSVSRHDAGTALAVTHRALAPATVVLALAAAVSGVFLLRTATAGTVTLAVLLAVVLVLRARAFPLTVEAGALLLAAAVVVVRLAALWGEPGIVVLALLAVLQLTVHPSETPRARLRRAADLLEPWAVLALVPAAVVVSGGFA
ncbi:type VII secretion integral membrane protein EccD [Streptomyces sp. SS1-1]|uniref:type VII secretion integral membrane protein EccD n=1 Tax=Streptomyces sp. SS1-1 TaxID=2651869 RepID=UPI00124FEACE|nr:type VII secretion integral membrane protein EccD [Streptomyces sp. SS1-1]KAB2973502.1 type VII secretion integral membrane protein EccD [Streptomyces sp. SS1-1]